MELYSDSRTITPEELAGEAWDASATIPLSIFSAGLSGLQAIVRYLREEGLLPFREIARLLNRSPQTVWTSYHQARSAEFRFTEGGLRVPLAIFAGRRLSILESLVTHLRSLGFSNAETARLLRLDPRTTWTVASRARKKGVVPG